MTIGFKANNDGSGAIQVNGTDLLTVTPDYRIRGDFSNSTIANRAMFQNSVTNGVSYIHALPNGTATQSGLIAFNNSDPTNASVLQLGALSADVRLVSTITGTGTYLPMAFYTGGSERMRIATDGQQSSWCVDAMRPEYKCRAWVNFNGTGTVAIRASGNVTSITDIAVGQYTVNLTTAMPDVNYAVVGLNENSNNARDNLTFTTGTTSAFNVQVYSIYQTNAFVDCANVGIAIFR